MENERRIFNFFDMDFHSSEYTIEELTKEYNERVSAKLLELKSDMEKKGYEITSTKIFAESESGYYGDSYAKFFIRFYRTENDAEYSNRISIEEREKKKKEDANAKKQALESNPEYKAFLALKRKLKL